MNRSAEAVVQSQDEGAPEAVLDEPLKPGPSDLLQTVPPPPMEEAALDPELDPATYDAPTYVRPSLIDQEPMPILEIVQGNERGRSYRLEKEVSSLGRGLENDIVLTDIAVSRRHLRFIRYGMQVTVEDNGSGNGTVVNGARVPTAAIGPADRIEVGSTIVRIVFPGTESFAAAVPVAPPPPPRASSPLHNFATAYLPDGGQIVQQIGVGPSSASAPATPPPVAATPLQTAVVGGTTDGVVLARHAGVPRSFKIAMGALAAAIVLIGVVGLAAALLHVRSRGEAAAVPGAEGGPTAEELFGLGRQAFVERRWGQAADSFERVLAIAPDNQQARDFLAQARAEERNQGTLEAARQALREENFEDSVATLRTIPQSSVYQTEAAELRRESEQRQAAALVVEAARLYGERDGEAARARLEQALELNPASSEARALLSRLSGEGPSSGGEEPAPVAALGPSSSPGSDSPPAPRIPSPPRPQPPDTRTTPSRPVKGAPSGGLSQVIAAYKRGQFDAAAEQAREVSASGVSEADRSKARTLVRSIDRFAKLWAGIRSGGSTRQQMSDLENALRLDQQISGGHYGGQIRPKLREAYEGNAQRAWRAGQYATACQSALRALKAEPGASTAASISERCTTKAREYYEEGQAAAGSDLTQAKAMWRKVLNMVPRSDPWYTKAYSALNNAGRRRHLDEDE